MNMNEAIELVRENAFNIQHIPFELVDERLLRFVRRCNGWAVEVWFLSLAKGDKAEGKEKMKNVYYDIGIIRKYEEIAS